MATSDAPNHAWVKTEPLGPRLDLWWSKLLPSQQDEALAETFVTLPEWVAQGLLRAGVPLSIDPGINSAATAGDFLTPPEFSEFMERKRAAPVERKRFWQRNKS